MKKLFFILLITTFFPTVYAQEAKPGAGTLGNRKLQSEKSREPIIWSRQFFEFGADMRIGLDNSLIGTSELFRENVVIDLNKIQSSIRDGGLNFNADGDGDILYLDIINIKIKEGLWNFGFLVNADGKININVPKSLLTLITQGNIDQHTFEGMISVSGGVYADTSLTASAKYGKLRVGLKPSLFTPLLFIPKSGISYRLETENYIEFSSSGEISIYTPVKENGEYAGLKFGFDMSLNGEYALFPYLDIGGAVFRIPFAPATLQNRRKLRMSEIHYRLDGKKVMNGEMDEVPDIGKFDDPVYDSTPYRVFRPFRFDVYTRYKPFSTEILVIKPNIGFSFDINEKKSYFNAGLEIQSTLARDIIKLYLGMGYEESLWKHRFGFAINLRAFELGLEGTLRADNFPGSFKGQGFGVGLSTRFGW